MKACRVTGETAVTHVTCDSCGTEAPLRGSLPFSLYPYIEECQIGLYLFDLCALCRDEIIISLRVRQRAIGERLSK